MGQLRGIRGQRADREAGAPPDVVVWEADGTTDGRTGYGRAIAERLARSGLVVEVVPLPDRSPDARQLEAPAHVLSGGATAVAADDAWLEAARQRLAGVVDRALDGSATVTGICWGSQLLATCLVGRGAVRPHPLGMQAGLVPVGDERSPEGHVVGAFHYHHVDGAALRAAGVAVVLSSERTEVQAFEVGGVRGVQFHPELAPRALHRLLRHHRRAVQRHGGCPRAAAASLRTERARWSDALWRRFVGEPVAAAVVPAPIAA